MTELSNEARQLIEQASLQEEPTPGDFQRVSRGLRRRLLAAGVLALFVGVGRRVAAAVAVTSKGTLVGAGLVAATGVGVVTHIVSQSDTHTASPSQAVTPAQAKAIAAPPVSQPEPVAKEEPKPEPEVAPEPEPKVAAEPEVTPQASHPQPAVHKAEPSDLKAEALLLQSAQRALNSGKPGRAEKLLDKYDAEHSRGVLQAEREGLEVLALCASGDPEQARARARAFVKRWPKSPLRPRIEKTCKR